MESPVNVTLADGIAVKLPGSRTVPVICEYVDEIIQVQEEDIALAIVSLLEKTKLLVEGAGAVIGRIYPTAHYLTIARGAFNKGLGFADLAASFLPLAIACVVLLALSVALLKKQES